MAASMPSSCGWQSSTPSPTCLHDPLSGDSPHVRGRTLARLRGRSGGKIANAYPTSAMKKDHPLTRKEMIRLLNEDLAREYQAIIAYIVYSQIIRGAKYQHIAKELEKHAGEELSH